MGIQQGICGNTERDPRNTVRDLPRHWHPAQTHTRGSGCDSCSPSQWKNAKPTGRIPLQPSCPARDCSACWNPLHPQGFGSSSFPQHFPCSIRGLPHPLRHLPQSPGRGWAGGFAPGITRRVGIKGGSSDWGCPALFGIPQNCLDSLKTIWDLPALFGVPQDCLGSPSTVWGPSELFGVLQNCLGSANTI